MIDGVVRELGGRRLLVLGAGREGRSTLALLARWLPDAVIGVADADATAVERLGGDTPAGRIPAERLHGGAGYESAVERYDVVIRSPGVRLRQAHDARVQMTSQTDLFLRHAAATTVAVTGTKGKSTTSSLVAHLLRAAGRRVQHVGNIGVPPLEGLEAATPDSTAVLEVSSFQAQDLGAAPDVAVLLNLFPEHLDYYGSFEAYVAAKLGLVRHQDADDVVVASQDDPVLEEALRGVVSAAAAGAPRPARHGFSVGGEVARGACALDGMIHVRGEHGDVAVCALTDVRGLCGVHNHANVLAAVATCAALGVPAAAMAAALPGFAGLPHRIERVGVVDGVTWYDDSAASVPQATAAAVAALERVDTLIVGGLDRGLSLEPIVRAIVEHGVRQVVAMPETGLAVARALAAAGTGRVAVHEVADMQSAVSVARRITPVGGVCLLSPGAASYNRYAGFEARGRDFRQCLSESQTSPGTLTRP